MEIKVGDFVKFHTFLYPEAKGRVMEIATITDVLTYKVKTPYGVVIVAAANCSYLPKK